MGIVKRITDAVQAINHFGTGSVQDPLRTTLEEKPGNLSGMPVAVAKQDRDDLVYCYLYCNHETAEYSAWPHQGYMGTWKKKGVVLNKTTLEPMKFPDDSTCANIIPYPSSTGQDDPRQVYDLPKFVKICEDPRFGDGSNSVWSLPATAQGCEGQYTSPAGPPFSTMQISAISFACALAVVAAPAVLLGIGLAHCLRKCREDIKKAPSFEKLPAG